MHILTTRLTPPQLYQYLVGGILPRPIAWISTRSESGIDNIAPYSFFTVASCTPPVLSITHIHPSAHTEKDTLRNVKETGEAVVNIVSADLADAMNASCANLPADISEFEHVGIKRCDSQTVSPKSVANAKVRYECTLRDTLTLSDLPTGGTLILLDVQSIYVDDTLVSDGKILGDKLDAIGKLGGDLYGTTRDTFAMKRPE